MNAGKKVVSVVVLLTLAGCATLPSGPTVQVIPQQGKPFEVFGSEDAKCRLWAAQQIGMTQEEIANPNAITGAAVGAALGAGIGALMGSASGHAGAGAAIGAGAGALFGAAAGSDQDRVYGWKAQQGYDIAYAQCMYTHGNRLLEPVRVYTRHRVYLYDPEYYYYSAPRAPAAYQPPPAPNQPPPPGLPAVPPPGTPPPNLPAPPK